MPILDGIAIRRTTDARTASEVILSNWLRDQFADRKQHGNQLAPGQVQLS